MKDLTLERGHTNAKLVKSSLHKRQIYRRTNDPTLERGDTGTKRVISVLFKKEIGKSIRNLTL